ncbi:hypothetical protein BGZ51_006577 [Haplosporangium sp. Z 767]|nr:hypothetical protein BGZ50_006439 [Haplosporangium sp. Z 11]KAF9191857.1 hypothetical protein BGZ51_006577 [Haplosporangium sp. Z 767]
MWTTLLKSDCISYVVVPVASMDDIQSEFKNMSPSIRSVLMLNCGGLFTLEDFIKLSPDVAIYLLDSLRPVNLRNAFWNNEVIVFHENDLDKELTQEKEALIYTEENEYEPQRTSGRDSDDDYVGEDEDEDEDEDENNGDHIEEYDETHDEENHRRRRRRTGIDSEVIPGHNKRRWKESRAILVEYMSKGTRFGTSISSQTYVMATQLDRTSVGILWLAIVGLTSQYLNEQIGHKDYLDLVQIYKDESKRLAPNDRQSRGGATGRAVDLGSGPSSALPDDDECNQVYAHMSIDLKKILKERLEFVAPEYGLHEVLYTSFTRSYGFRGLMSASDVVYSVTSLLEFSPATSVALGYRSEWTADESAAMGNIAIGINGQEEVVGSSSWWHSNFFRACDSLETGGGEGDQLRKGLELCMKIQKAVVRQSIAIIEKQVIISLSTCRVATLKDGPDLPIFWNPITLKKLAQFLVYAIREYGGKSGHRSIPLVLAVLKEETQTFIVTGVHGSPIIGEVIPNKFGIVFERISYNEKIPVKHLGFDKSVIEIDRDDMESFMNSIGRYLRQ